MASFDEELVPQQEVRRTACVNIPCMRLKVCFYMLASALSDVYKASHDDLSFRSDGLKF